MLKGIKKNLGALKNEGKSIQGHPPIQAPPGPISWILEEFW